MDTPQQLRPAFRRRLRQRIVGIAVRIVTERASPGRIGWAVAVGVIVGTTPFFGLHLPLCIAIATLLGLNRAVTYLAANISIPPVAPLLAFASIQLGTLVQTGAPLPLSFAAFADVNPATFLRAWLLGSLILGVGLAGPAGAFAFAATSAYRRRHPLEPDPVGDVLVSLATRFRIAGSLATLPTRTRLRYDPIYRLLADRGPWLAPVVDLGCGDGTRLLLLRTLDPALEVSGFDPDARALARALVVGYGIISQHSVRVGALATAEIPAAGTVLLIDRLRYIDAATQDTLLTAAATALLPGGHLYIREIDVDAGVRALHATLWDRVAALVGLRPGRFAHLRPARQIASVLEGAGLCVELEYLADDLGDVLIVARRPDVAAG